ncbi:MAG: response regulator receiver protein [Candidatus Magnetoglobus multicellularis str. Araruama]|uniref:Response regulator receiver protein n=1 Tax=Candidatus Magnetoglobus multicellularis str. Araruama TaxID=890399 RepID=A0A1V1P7D5_9BACT|nr:MAG: response regulator receiver protein [Candidatus Magnetoglobus multicellularis str. Araruama]
MKKILLVDDSRFVRNTTKKLLIELGYDDSIIYEASTGEEAITIHEKERPDFIFLDLLMPGMGGEEALRQIREKDKDCYISILSSNFQKPVQERVLQSGANLFIEKNINAQKIKEVITAYDSTR